MGGAGVTDSGSRGPTGQVRPFLPSFSSLLHDGSGAPAIAGDGRRLREGICGRERNGKTEAVLGVVDGSAEVEGVTDGELRGGGKLRW